MIYHTVVGKAAGKRLEEAFPEEAVIILEDHLNVGPLHRTEGSSFSGMRTLFWQGIHQDNSLEPVQDLENILKISTALNNHTDDQLWIWLGDLPTDLSAFHWQLDVLQKHLGKIMVVSLAGMPFLDEQQRLYFPKGFSEIQPGELRKARKLVRPVTASELEVEVDAWQKVVTENEGLRIPGGLRKLRSVPISHFDEALEKACNPNFAKASRIISLIQKEAPTHTGDAFLRWRLAVLARQGKLSMREQAGGKAREQEFALPQDQQSGVAESITEQADGV